MKAITLQNPWAWAVFHAGKAIENRSWPTPYRGPLLIHAAKSAQRYNAERTAYLDDWGPGRVYGVELPPRAALAFGAIIGMVDLLDCLSIDSGDPRLTGPFAEGPWCFILTNPRPFAVPIPLTGQLGLFNVPDAILEGKILG